jgi:hypothetical protein
VSTDEKIKPAVEQKPPDLEELAKNYFWKFLHRTFGRAEPSLFF